MLLQGNHHALLIQKVRVRHSGSITDAWIQTLSVHSSCRGPDNAFGKENIRSKATEDGWISTTSTAADQ